MKFYVYIDGIIDHFEIYNEVELSEIDWDLVQSKLKEFGEEEGSNIVLLPLNS